MADRVEIFDTTLRDGEQSPGASMDGHQKIEIALQLERLGVDIIEAGFPIASDDEFEGVKRVAAAVKRPRIAALARAIATQPHILLLDEPFASLDIELREQIAKEMRAILKRNGVTTILVSHNQLEAFAMADTIGVMRNGAILQWDNAFTLYHRPVCTYVADFIGDGVFLPGKVINSTNVETELGVIKGGQSHGFSHGDGINVLIRPDDIIHDDSSEMQAKVLDKAFRGAEFLYTLSLQSGAQVLSLVPSHHNHAIDESIGIRLDIDHLVVVSSA